MKIECSSEKLARSIHRHRTEEGEWMKGRKAQREGGKQEWEEEGNGEVGSG